MRKQAIKAMTLSLMRVVILLVLRVGIFKNNAFKINRNNMEQAPIEVENWLKELGLDIYKK